MFIIWSYYGRKTKVVKYYPNPKYDTIIEPFAGTAVYSLYKDNWQKNVILIDTYEVIVKLWKYLQQASPKDILSLPDMNKGDKVPNYLCDEEKWLIGFCINRGSANPKVTAKEFNSWNTDKIRIANDLYKIKHWTIIQGSYELAGDVEATWFIDPPYQYGGKYYKDSNIDYIKLSEWCKSRKGQIIVCENTKADWLDFKPLKDMRGQLHSTTEAIWYKEKDHQI